MKTPVDQSSNKKRNVDELVKLHTFRYNRYKISSETVFGIQKKTNVDTNYNEVKITVNSLKKKHLLFCGKEQICKITICQ